MYNVGILLGIVSAAAYGLLDICAACIARQMASLRALTVAHLLSAFLLLEWIMGSNMVDRVQYQVAWAALPDMVLTGVVLGCLNAFANVCLYKAFATGKLAIISPLVSAYGIVPVFLYLIAEHEAPTPFMLVCGVMVLVGMVLVSSSSTAPSAPLPPQVQLLHIRVAAFAEMQLIHPLPLLRSWMHALNRSVIWACGALLGFGLETYIMSRSTALFGPVVPLFFSRVTSTLLLGGLLCSVYWYRRCSRSLQHQQLGRDHRASSKQWWRWLVIAMMSVADLLGALSFSIGTQLAPTSIIALLSLSYPVFPLLFGLKVYRERLSVQQWWGLACLFPGIFGLVLMDSEVLRQAGEMVRQYGGLISIAACEFIVGALAWTAIVKARQKRRFSGRTRLLIGLKPGVPFENGFVAPAVHETAIAIYPVTIVASKYGRELRFARARYSGAVFSGVCGMDEPLQSIPPEISRGKDGQDGVSLSALEKKCAV